LEWHPLADHCADVAAITEALLELPLWRERLSRLAGKYLNEVDVNRLCVLTALHDIGKLNIGFQAKGRPNLGTTAGHVTEALGALFRPDVFSCLRELQAWGDGVTDLLISALCHHGRPHNASAPVHGELLSS
jgi:CRISPR-associated endonuclease/helicase Cas3